MQPKSYRGVHFILLLYVYNIRVQQNKHRRLKRPNALQFFINTCSSFYNYIYYIITSRVRLLIHWYLLAERELCCMAQSRDTYIGLYQRHSDAIPRTAHSPWQVHSELSYTTTTDVGRSLYLVQDNRNHELYIFFTALKASIYIDGPLLRLYHKRCRLICRQRQQSCTVFGNGLSTYLSLIHSSDHIQRPC